MISHPNHELRTNEYDDYSTRALLEEEEAKRMTQMMVVVKKDLMIESMAVLMIELMIQVSKRWV